MSSKIIAPTKGQWIVKLDILQECKQCRIFFTNASKFRKHLKSNNHKTETNESQADIQMDETNSVESELTIVSNQNNPEKVSRPDEYQIIRNEEGTKFQCNKCDEVFFQRNSFYQHILKSHSEKTLECNNCHKKFSNSSVLKLHVSSCNVIIKRKKVNAKSREKKHKCNKCSRAFNKLGNLQRHMVKCDVKYNYQTLKCDKCSIHFASTSKLSRHEKHCGKIVESKYEIIKDKECNKYQCKNCQEIFSEKAKFHIHYRQHLEKNLKCEKCSEMFAFRYSLNRHSKKCGQDDKTKTIKHPKTKSKNLMKGVEYNEISDIEGKKEFQCLTCEKTFLTTRLVYTHVLSNHKEKKHRCNKCDKTFFYQSNLNKHSKKCGKFVKSIMKGVDYKEISDIEGKKKYQCLTCEKTFLTWRLAYGHVLHKHKEEKHKCNKCNTTFLFTSNLKHHLEKCDGILRIKKRQKNSSQVIKTNDGKKYQCNTCQETFSEKLKLHSHYFTHKEKNFKCNICSKLFIYKIELDSHYLSCENKVHLEKDHKCDKCTQSFVNKNNLKRHIKTIHNEPFKDKSSNITCDTCGKNFIDRWKLRRHLTSHCFEIIILDGKRTIQCKKCEQSFKSNPNFYQHFYKKHIDKNVKLYTCYLCEKIYTDRRELKKHLQGHESSKHQYEIIYASPTDLTKQYWCKKCQNTFIDLLLFNHHFMESHFNNGKSE